MEIYKALQLISSSSKDQINYLRELGTYPSTDELALQFDDAFKVYLGNDDKEQISVNDSLQEKLRNIALLFNQMSDSNDKSLWDVVSLERPEWIKVRTLAKEALQLMEG
jgi:hypothetical protein